MYSVIEWWVGAWCDTPQFCDPQVFVSVRLLVYFYHVLFPPLLPRFHRASFSSLRSSAFWRLPPVAKPPFQSPSSSALAFLVSHLASVFPHSVWSFLVECYSELPLLGSCALRLVYRCLLLAFSWDCVSSLRFLFLQLYLNGILS